MNAEALEVKIEKLSPKEGDLLIFNVGDGDVFQPLHVPNELFSRLKQRGIDCLIVGDIEIQSLNEEQLSAIGLQRIARKE